jgi:hypothetical protein
VTEQRAPAPPLTPVIASVAMGGAPHAPRQAPLTVDFGTLLMLANVTIAALIVWGWSIRGGNEYTDGLTPVLGVLLCVQNIVALALEARRRDPFVILLVFFMTFYFALRIFTLILYPFSGVFERFEYTPGDTDYALAFIIVANLFLYAGLRVVHFNDNLAVDVGRWRASSPFRAGILLMMAVGFGYFSSNYWTPENIPRVLNFLVLFISQHIIILMALSYYILFRRSFSLLAAVMLAFLVVAEIVLSVLFGSRSAIVTTIQSVMMVGLGITGYIKIRASYLALGVLSLPLLVLLAGASFLIATHNRVSKDTGEKFNVSRAVEFSREGARSLGDESSLEVLLPPIFARGGFFDFAAELIAHREEYASIFQPSTYYKSIVDNLLTPGFDVYDQPRIANALEFVYDNMGDPSKEIAEEFYQSDQLEIYGEFYAMYAWASLPLFFLVSWLIKRTYVRLKAPNPYSLTMKRVVLLFIWVEIINSFGLDWLAYEVFPLVVAIFMWRWFFASRLPGRRRRTPPERKALAAPTAQPGALGA